jgi:predicted transcriptional regulator
MNLIKQIIDSIFKEQILNINKCINNKINKLMLLSLINQTITSLLAISILGNVIALTLNYGSQTIDAKTMEVLLWIFIPTIISSLAILCFIIQKSKINIKTVDNKKSINIIELMDIINKLKEGFSTTPDVNEKFNQIDKTLVSISEALTALNDKINEKD